MSFDALKAADVSLRKKDIVIKVGESSYTFTAKEMTYLQRLHLSAVQNAGDDTFSQIIAYCIYDSAGKQMTVRQANELSEDHANIFLNAATEVNGAVDPEKN